MSMDRTLKSHSGLSGRRSVLTRAERIERLADEGQFDLEQDSPFGLPKVSTLSLVKAGGKGKKEEPEQGAEGAEGAEGSEAPAEG